MSALIENPKQSGHYLVAAFEWVGLAADKPQSPSWKIRLWNGHYWERERYNFDTGNYENFELVAWQDLPPIPSRQ